MSRGRNDYEGLMLCVLDRALKDAGAIESGGGWRVSEVQRQRIRRWLMSERSNFADICALINVDANNIRRALWETTRWARHYADRQEVFQ